MAREKALWVAFLVSALAHAAAMAAGWTAIAPDGTAEEGEWSCAFMVGSLCETAGPAPSSAALVPAPAPGAGDNTSSPTADSAQEKDRARRECVASVPSPASVPAAENEASPYRKDTEQSAKPPALLASLPSMGNDGRATRAGAGDRNEYLDTIRRRISRMKRFPPEALNEGIEGTAIVGFRIARDGTVSGVRVVRSSRAPILDSEGEMTVQRAAPFPPIPERLGAAPIDLQVPISFEIERR